MLDADGYPLSLPGSWSILLGSLLRTGEDISAVDPVQQVANYGSRPLLIIDGGQDHLDRPRRRGRAAGRRRGRRRGRRSSRSARRRGHGESLEACAGEYRDWVLGFLTRSLAP